MPLVDIHCHLLAGLDDGPETLEDAVQMCRAAWADGTRAIAATAHMGERWPAVTPAAIRGATSMLADELRAAGLAMSVYPSAEIMVRPDLDVLWNQGALMSIADREAYLLMEYPHGVFFDLRDTVRGLLAAGVRPILAHAERCPELLYAPQTAEALVASGCLIQVSSGSVVGTGNDRAHRALRHWFRRGLVHVLGSDGHSVWERPPRMKAAYHQIVSWVGTAVADRLCSLHALVIIEGRPLRPARPASPRPKFYSWFRRAWGCRG